MLIEIDPADIEIGSRPKGEGFQVCAVWKRNGIVADAECAFEDDQRILIKMIEVLECAVIRKKSLLRKARHANFRGLGIGSRIVREVVRQAKRHRARELYGYIIQHRLDANPFLLEWYEKEGFEICAPDPDYRFPHCNRIVMQFGI